MGSLIYPAPEVNKETFIDGCINYSIDNSTYIMQVQQSPNDYRIYHMAFLLVPVSGFIISLVLGLIVSLLTGKYIYKIFSESLPYSLNLTKGE